MKRMNHDIPRDDIGPHIEELYCECIVWISADDPLTVIHNRFEHLQE